MLLGEVDTVTYGNNIPATWYITAPQSVQISAGRDIVNFGTGSSSGITPSLILNNDATDISVIEAGRDMWYTNVQIAGPGTLVVSAGRNRYQGDKGSIVSVGPIATGDNRSGASILMQAGKGPEGPNYEGLLPYLDPANLAVFGTPLVDQPGKVAKTYEKELAAWLKDRYGYEQVGDEETLAYFNDLAAEQQNIFLRTVYFSELREGGREYNDLESTRFQSYFRGRQVMAALFPEEDAAGQPINYAGDITCSAIRVCVLSSAATFSSSCRAARSFCSRIFVWSSRTM